MLITKTLPHSSAFMFFLNEIQKGGILQYISVTASEDR